MPAVQVTQHSSEVQAGVAALAVAGALLLVVAPTIAHQSGHFPAQDV